MSVIVMMQIYRAGSGATSRFWEGQIGRNGRYARKNAGFAIRLRARSSGSGAGHDTLTLLPIELAENIQRRLIPCAREVLGDGISEQRIVGHRAEQRHRRAKLEIVGR